MTRLEKGELRWGIFFILPWLLGLIIFTAYPIVMSFYYSFTDYSIVQEPFWVGLDNYKTLIRIDAIFWKSLENTFYMLGLGLPLSLIAGLLLAILLNMKVKGMAIHRTIFYLPSILPEVATAILWVWLFNPQYGLVNAILSWFGINGPGWLADPAWAKPALILMGLWGVGGGMIIYLASLQDVPQELYEAAELDGARGWQKMVHITLPMISPVIFFNLIMGIIGTFQFSVQTFVATGGGPAYSTMFYGLYLYYNAFQWWKMGYASAMAWILFLITLLMTILIFKTSAGWVYYHTESK
jgi:multiple sugar transport system permease protein